MNKEISDSLHFLLHCSLKAAGYETLREQFEFIYEYIEELEKIKDNWDELKKWVKYHYDYYINSHDYIGGRLCFADIKNKIEKLEQEGDKNEF